MGLNWPPAAGSAAPGSAAGGALGTRTGMAEQHRRGHLLQMALRDHRVAVSCEDHLALLGDLEPAGHRAGCLREHRAAGRPAAAPERPAAAVEQGQPDVALRCPPRQPLLCVEQAQRRADRAEFLGRVGIAEHDLQVPAGGGQPRRHWLELQHVVQHLGGVREVSPALEQRDHVEYGDWLVINREAALARRRPRCPRPTW
jgi:hypothetical protein